MIIITNVKNDVPMSKEELEKRIRDIEKRLKELEYKHAIIGRYRLLRDLMDQCNCFESW